MKLLSYFHEKVIKSYEMLSRFSTIFSVHGKFVTQNLVVYIFVHLLMDCNLAGQTLLVLWNLGISDEDKTVSCMVNCFIFSV